MQQWVYTKKITFILLAGVAMLLSCNKNDFLNKKPSSDLLIPATLPHFQALLDNDLVMQETPELGELSTDDLYLDSSSNSWVKISLVERNAYAWAIDIFGKKGTSGDWDLPYQQVFYANIVLEGLQKVTVNSNNAEQWNALQGAAYFNRAYAFYNLAQVFAPVYNSSTAGSDLGIPLRLTSDIGQVSARASVMDTYDRILSDLQKASSLLPSLPDRAHLNRPSKAATLAMLARVYLSMRKYDSAGLYADSCLTIYSTLIDYNPIMPRDTIFYFQKTNDETLYQSHILSTSTAIGALAYPCIVDSNLYRSYADSDLRKYIFFHKTRNGPITANTDYAGTVYLFSGLAIDEVTLIKAECLARIGQNGPAANCLNNLLINRWVKNSFVAYTAATVTVDTILAERRKELVFRGLRWTDLRRYNADGLNITLTRWLTDTLKPNDQRYVLPIPPDVTGLLPNKR
jgi:starch-binding outer membrane protein, SusD/RagB family